MVGRLPEGAGFALAGGLAVAVAVGLAEAVVPLGVRGMRGSARLGGGGAGGFVVLGGGGWIAPPGRIGSSFGRPGLVVGPGAGCCG